MPQELIIGDRVRHPTKPEWGLGQVSKVDGSKLTGYFEDGREHTLRSDFITLEKVVGDEGRSIILDAKPKTKRNPKRQHYSLEALIDLFLQEFPGGFHGDRFASHERDYKMAGHELALDLLNEQGLREAFVRRDFDDIIGRSRRVIQKLNLPSPYEVMKFRSGVEGKEEIFAEGLVDFLYGRDDFLVRFDRFAAILLEINSAKWPIITYYPFILFPNEHMFLKPEVTRAAADACRFELMYRPQINSRTYSRLLEFSNHLKIQLSDLEPRDMIDVQSFIWCVEKVSRGEY